jgi:hypothetical protein
MDPTIHQPVKSASLRNTMHAKQPLTTHVRRSSQLDRLVNEWKRIRKTY